MNLAGLRAFLPDRRHAWIVAGYGVAFFSLEVLTIGFRQTTGVNMWFPPPALTLALVLTFGKPVVWAAFLAHLPYGLIFRAPIIDIPTTLLICIAHGVAYGGTALLARGRGLTGGLGRLRDLAGFLLLVALSSGLLALLIASILAARALGFAQFGPLFSSLWRGDAVGLLCLAPFLLIWVAPALQGHQPDPNREFSPARVVEALAQGLFLLVTSIVIMLQQQGQVFPMKYLALFPLLWIALRWGTRGAAAAVLGYGLVTTSAFMALGYPKSLLGDLQIFLAFLAPLTLLLGTLADVRRRAERSLKEQSARLASILRATGAYPFELDRATGRTLVMDEHLSASLKVDPSEWNSLPYWAALLPAGDRDRFRAFCVGSFEGTLELRVGMGPGGDRFLLVVAGKRAGSRISGILLDVHERKEAQRRLEASEALYRATVESLDEGVVVRDLAGRVRSMNDSARRILGEMPLGEPSAPEEVESLDEEGHPIPWEDQPPMVALRKRIAIHSVMGLRRKDGSIRWITVRSRPLWNGSELQGVVSSSLDVTEERTAVAELRSSEANLQESLKEKDLAIREIHHRVKNNLQVVSSLLRLQALHSGNPEVIRALTEAQERIQAIALVHARLHQAPTLAKADLRDYLSRLVAQLVRSFASAPSLVDATVEVAELSLGPDDLVPLALVLHELVLNALRHGFPPGQGGALFVALAKDPEGRVTLRVEDDGQGLPEGFDPLQEGSLGFQLVRALTDQLKGTFQTTRRRGAAFQLTFTPRSP